MAVLSDGALIDLILSKKLIVKPFVLENVQPSSIDLCLDEIIKIPADTSECVDIAENSAHLFREDKINDSYVLKSGQLILGQTFEYISIPNDCNGHIYNRSSLARIGLEVATGSYINPGYVGKLPIVLKNIGAHDIRLTPERRICQLEITTLNEKSIRDYSQRKDAKYFDEKDSLVSLIHKDIEILEYKKIKSGKIDHYALREFLDARISKSSREIVDGMSEELKHKLGLL
jgi:dCTP deaminase